MMMFIRSLPAMVSNAKFSGAICTVSMSRGHRGGRRITGILEIEHQDGHLLRWLEAKQLLVEIKGVEEGARGMRHQVVLRARQVHEAHTLGLRGRKLRGRSRRQRG